MAEPNRIQSLDEFRASVTSARYDDVRTRPGANVASADAFEEMRRFVLDLYDGAEGRHAFLESGGRVVDCIPVDLQPSLKNSGKKPPTPPSSRLLPPPAPERRDDAPAPKAPPPMLHPDYRDRLGNQMWCPDGTIPMIRIPLEDLAGARDLRELLGGARVNEDKRYGRGFQHIDNIGGSSYVNVWQPRVFGVQNSASQLWFGTPQAPFVTYQSVECGWRVGNPSRLFDRVPRLFVYYTANNHRPGFYNLQGGFQQVNGSSSVLGAGLQVSQSGGDQFEYQMGFVLTGGAWWFNFQGEWLGCYPTFLFGDGVLATHAETAEFGGETSGVGAFSAMGSGAFPIGAFGVAAYQRNVFITPVGGVAQPGILTPGVQSPSCYNTLIANNTPSTFGTHLYFGGPGGVGCPEVP